MKRSEFVKQAAETYGLSGTGIGESVANMATNQLGVKWDPEEPEELELPKRLCGTSGGFFAEDERGWLIAQAADPTHGEHPGRKWACLTLLAMVDAYNRLQSGELVAHMPVAGGCSARAILGVDMDKRGGGDSLDEMTAHFLSTLIGEIATEAGASGSGSAHYIRRQVVAKLRSYHAILRERDQLRIDCANLRREALALCNGRKPADIISKTRHGKTVHYAIGPTRETREEAERDLREWFDKEAS